MSAALLKCCDAKPPSRRLFSDEMIQADDPRPAGSKALYQTVVQHSEDKELKQGAH